MFCTETNKKNESYKIGGSLAISTKKHGIVWVTYSNVHTQLIVIQLSSASVGLLKANPIYIG